MRIRWVLLEMVIVIVLLAVMPRHSLMQDSGAGSCPAVVEQALHDLGDNCGDLGRNSACYGFNRVSALFSQDVADNVFSKPSDRSDLNVMESIQTAPLDTILNQWGVAALSVQANIPNTLPGQSARFILLGDVSVTNDVPPEEGAQAAVEPVSVTTSVGANIRSAPTTRANVLGSVPPGSPLQADALSTDGGWLRVIYAETTIGWVSREVIQSTDAIDALPAVDEERRTPMQAFHFTTGIGQPTCEESPSLLVVQGPENIKIAITANGADINIGSTIVLITDGTKLKLITVHGKAEVGGLTVPAGFSVEAPVSDKGDVNGDFGAFHHLTQAELDALKTLENIPENVLNYPIRLPTLPAIQAGQGNAPAAGLADCSAFRPTSPLDGFAFGYNTFYWDPAPGATSYRVTVPGVGSVETPAPNTTASLDLSSAGFNPQMSWYVEALVDGRTACISQTVTIPREAPPPSGNTALTFNASWTCSSPGFIVFSVSNLPPGTTGVKIIYSGPVHFPVSGTVFPIPPYTHTVSGTPGLMTGATFIAQPSGATVTLGALGVC